MKIALGTDHAGLDAKNHLVGVLREQGHEALDLGPHGTDSVDYPDFARAVAQAVAEGRADYGVLICGTGIGMSMTANRIPGVRAAVCHDEFTTEMTRRHNDANVICLGARSLALPAMERYLLLFVATPFDGGRHEKRVRKIENA